MKRFPFITRYTSYVVLRLSVSFVFMAHAAVRIVNDTIPAFSHFLDTKGFLFSKAVVWAITLFELAGSAALATGFLVRWIAAGFILILVTGIVLIHASYGWFVGEHGTGGSEYSFILIVCLLVIAAFENQGLGSKLFVFSGKEKNN